MSKVDLVEKVSINLTVEEYGILVAGLFDTAVWFTSEVAAGDELLQDWADLCSDLIAIVDPDLSFSSIYCREQYDQELQ